MQHELSCEKAGMSKHSGRCHYQHNHYQTVEDTDIIHGHSCCGVFLIARAKGQRVASWFASKMEVRVWLM
jgi:hypothetical protein